VKSWSVEKKEMAARLASNVTTILQELHAGDQDAQNRLLNSVYEELHRMAADCMRRERPDHTLQPTALVHEAFVRLFGNNFQAQDRQHFFWQAARAMRQILIEHANRRKTQKRGGNWHRTSLDNVSDYFEKQQIDVVELEDALARLATRNERPSQVVTLLYLWSYSAKEVAEILEISMSTLESDLRFAKAWLRGQLTGPK
jgi:RNA polymerase sigma-70 factor, ECF subfamily